MFELLTVLVVISDAAEYDAITRSLARESVVRVPGFRGAARLFLFVEACATAVPPGCHSGATGAAGT